MLFPPKPANAFPNPAAAEEQITREHRYVCLDVYIQPLNTQRTMELGWVPVTRTTKARSGEPRSPVNGLVLTDARPEVAYSLDSRHAMSVLQNLCVTQGLQLTHLRVAISPPDGASNPKELPLDPLMNVGNVAIPCKLSPTDGSVRCQMRVFSTIAPPEQPPAVTPPAAPIVAGKQIPKLQEVAAETPEYGFHSDAGVMEILRPSQPSLEEQQTAIRERVKGITDRGRLCKELRNAVPSHLKKRKNRRAVIKTLKDLEEYMGSIDPVFEECGNTPELCATAARTIGLSNTRFIELRRMWEAYLEEMRAENHEVMELSPNKEACTLRKLVAVLERYGWSCTSAQPRSSEDISKPPRPPTVIESPNWLGALRKRPSLNTLNIHQFDSDYESDFSPKRPRSEYASSEDGNTSDEGEVFSAPEPLITSMFEQKYPMLSAPGPAEEPSLLDDTFFLPTWTPRDSSSSDVPNITFDAPDVDLFNELERQILSEFL